MSLGVEQVRSLCSRSRKEPRCRARFGLQRAAGERTDSISTPPDAMTTRPPSAFAHPPATLRLGDLEVVRLGYGAMRPPGPDVWGSPTIRPSAREVLGRVVALGINLIASPGSTGLTSRTGSSPRRCTRIPGIWSLRPSSGERRLPDKGWASFCRPEEWPEGCETDLRELRREVLDVVHP
jgi:pyridoxine 4-dehydrogenase